MASLFLPLPAIADSVHELVTPALIDNLDGTAPVLRPLVANSGFTVADHAVNYSIFQQGSGAEFLRLQGPAGRTVQVAYSVAHAPVIQEFQIRANVLSNRPGLLLAAKVVLPRSLDQSTGQPYELLVRATKPGRGSNWELLTLENLPRLLANHARVARAQSGVSLDEREAFVSEIVFLCPGGTGATELYLDQIQVFGVLNQQQMPFQKSKAKSLAIQSHRGNLSFNQRTQVPRIFQWQGEAFQLIKRLGFNCVGMSRLPTDQQLQEAEKLGLALVCPPPTTQQLIDHGIGDKYSPVMAWDLGEQVSSDELDYVQRWEQLVARHDPIADRETVLAPQLHTLEASRISDILLMGRSVLSTQLTVQEHAAWLTQRKQLARPGTPIWNKIETELGSNQQLQLVALSQHHVKDPVANYSQLTAMTTAAMGIRTQGFYFQSQTALSAHDQSSRTRAFALELINLRLQLAEPWLAAGKKISAARSSQPELSALLLQAERSHLMVPVWWSSTFQMPTLNRRRNPVSFVVPGVSESSAAYLITLGGLQRIRQQRVTGGMRISLEQLPFDSFLLFTDDPQAVAQITRFLHRIAPRAASIRYELAKSRLQTIERSLPAITISNNLNKAIAQAKVELNTSAQYIKSKNYERAYLHADAVELVLDHSESKLRGKVNGNRHQESNNLSHLTLPDEIQLHKTIARSPLTANLIEAGGFENLVNLLDSGWRHQQLPLEGVTSAVRLSPEAPHSGSFCLELEAQPLDETAPSTIVPTAPVWISTAPIRVPAGVLLEITGVARIPEPLLGSVDSLQIIDSLGGPDLALRIREAPSWQPFRIIRAATSESELKVTIALTGLGKAQVDDLAVRVIQRK